MANQDNTHYSYWLRPPACIDTRRGFVGITIHPSRVLRAKVLLGAVPGGSELEILFQGTKGECLAFNKQLRPYPHMGWNERNYRGSYAISEQGRERLKVIYSNRSEEGRAHIAGKIRDAHANRTPAQNAASKPLRVRKIKQAYANRTPEQKEATKALMSAKMTRVWAAKSVEERRRHGAKISRTVRAKSPEARQKTREKITATKRDTKKQVVA